ncbi:agmatinase, mitochondrial [Siniperca chuatsi]|uniref:agmatinase, mitochondrial n=1 Tax=Siniperca chuatsi TaxID=119488 RepID=UPI001CE155CF|nr:agmatinase, mitochondrial [Siniperca chuatsi]
MNITSLLGNTKGSSGSPSHPLTHRTVTSMAYTHNSHQVMLSVWKKITRAVISPSCSGTAAGFSLGPRQTLSLCSDRRGLYINPNRKSSGKRYNVPPSAEFVARVSGIPTMAKLPYQETADGLDAAFVGVPIDTGTSNRPGARFGPRQIRVESAMLRSYNSGTRAAPYESLMVADIGDVNVNMYDLKDTCKRIREAYWKILATGCIPLTMGGDHTIAYPILQAVAEKYGPVGLVHVDAHADTSDVVLGEKIGHGTPFRRCVEEGLLDCKRVVQIGLRGSGYSADSYEWNRSQGFRVVQVEECWFKSLAPLMAEVRAQMGSGPVYLSFDIDALDPGFAPGTGTPEIAGLTPIQGVEIIRGCRGLNLVGCDLVEVSPPYDTTGNTALTGANLLFEMLCVLPKIKYS